MTPSTALARAIVEELLAAGLHEVVLCPGSRSAPLAYAVAAADRAGLLRLHVRVDERSAAFLALGLGKVSGVPAAIITTSGTAVANLHPAVLEAHHAHVPLVVVSADRPGELRGTGSNQTTTQPGVFAGALRFEVDLRPETPTDEVRGVVHEAVAHAVTGPVHLNVQLREPLVPDTGESADGWPPARTAASWTDVDGDRRATLDAEHRATAGLRDRAAVVLGDLPSRTLVVLGDLPRAGQAATALAWAGSHGWPVVAEPFGPHPRPAVVSHGVLVVGDQEFLDANAPDCVAVIGRPTLSRPVSALVRRAGQRLVILDPGLVWRVPGIPADVVPFAALDEDLAGHSPRGHEALPGGRRPPSAGSPSPELVVDPGWRDAWLDRGGLVETAVAAAPPEWPSGAAIARLLGAALPRGALLFTGSSNSPRDLDVALGPDTRAIDIVASRGLAGIDGCISTAVGIALSQPGRPAYALIGDLTFLHDTNGLLVGPSEPRPNLTVVVVNDDGGGIFTLLEPGAPDRATDFERLFGTPTGTDLAALCRAHGVRHVLAATSSHLAEVVKQPPDGITVVEVRVDRATHRAEHARLQALATGVASSD